MLDSGTDSVAALLCRIFVSRQDSVPSQTAVYVADVACCPGGVVFYGRWSCVALWRLVPSQLYYAVGGSTVGHLCGLFRWIYAKASALYVVCGKVFVGGAGYAHNCN